MDSFKRTGAARTLRKGLIHMNKISGSFVGHPSALRYAFMWVAQTQTDRYLLLPFVFVHYRNMNQWTEKTHDREKKKSPSHEVAEIKTGTNRCFFTSANTKCLTMQSKMANLMKEEQKILREARKTSLGGSSLSGSCDLTAGSDFTFGLTASTSSIEHPQRNRDGGFFFLLQTPAACSRLATPPVSDTRVGGRGEREKAKRRERVKTGIRNFLKGSHLISWLTWL